MMCAWQHHVITWSNASSAAMMSWGIELKEITLEIHKISIRKMCLKLDIQNYSYVAQGWMS